MSYSPYQPGTAPGYPPPSQGYPAPGFAAEQAYPPPAQGYPPPAQGYPPPGMGHPTSQGDTAYGGPPITQPPSVSQGGYPPPAMGAGYGAAPPAVPNCPPGLEYLTAIDQLLVKQKVELLEAFLGFETQNKYTIKNSMGQKVYHATEGKSDVLNTDCCTRNCCGPARPFDIKVADNSGNEVLHFQRDLRCTSCCCPCCLQRLEVSAPPGRPIGWVVQEWSILTPQFRVENAAGECVLRIEGPICTMSICGDVEFKVLSKDGSVEVGKISKQWAGLLKEAFTDTDNFGISFPMDLDVHMKAVLLGALFLIDYMFFEKAGNKEQDGPGML
ncbi:unnamed protein product [Ixodes persulcatus]